MEGIGLSYDQVIIIPDSAYVVLRFMPIFLVCVKEVFNDTLDEMGEPGKIFFIISFSLLNLMSSRAHKCEMFFFNQYALSGSLMYGFFLRDTPYPPNPDWKQRQRKPWEKVGEKLRQRDLKNI